MAEEIFVLEHFYASPYLFTEPSRFQYVLNLDERQH